MAKKVRLSLELNHVVHTISSSEGDLIEFTRTRELAILVKVNTWYFL